jgi:uncharacterized protein (TIGR03086 family)
MLAPDALELESARLGWPSTVRREAVMQADPLDLYRQASQWTAEKVAGVRDLGAATPCPEWRVRDLLNHMLDTQRYFAAAARGEKAARPAPSPPSLLTDDPVSDFARATTDVTDAFSQEGAVEKTGPALGIAFSDQLLHGWDLARATNQDATMPEGLAQAAYECIHGRFTDDQRQGVFGPEIAVGDDATPQQRLLAYTGRAPS